MPVIESQKLLGADSARPGDEFMAGRFGRAEVLYRAQLVQYLGWVYEHTVPFASLL